MGSNEVTAAGRVVDADPPWAYIPGDRRRAIAAGESLPIQVSGAAFFAVLSSRTSKTKFAD